jgi:hypothetical protein
MVRYGRRVDEFPKTFAPLPIQKILFEERFVFRISIGELKPRKLQLMINWSFIKDMLHLFFHPF